jgi:hypothetical protein
MKMKTFLSLLLLFMFILSGFTPRAGQAEEGWQTLVDNSIWYREYFLSNPYNHVYVARMLRDSSNTSLETSLGLGNLKPGSETMSSQFTRFDQSLSFWDWNADGSEDNNWGNRNQVIVAINGGYVNSDGTLQSGFIHSTWYSKRFLEQQTFSGLSWKKDRSLFIGGLVTHVDNKQLVTFPDSSTLEIDGVNVARSNEQLILFTPQYDKTTPPLSTEAGETDLRASPEASPLVEIVLQMKKPALVSLQSDDAEGIVRQIRTNTGSTPILFDQVVLSASGNLASTLQSKVSIGDTLGIAQNIKDNTSKDWLGSYAAIQNDFYFLKNGVVNGYLDKPTANTRAPRTAIVFNNKYVFFIVVDGRNPGISHGMTIQELGEFSLTLDDPENGNMEGTALDGGGSSTMVVNGNVMNFPSDGVLNPYALFKEDQTCDPPPAPGSDTYCSLYIPVVQGGVADPVSPTLPPVKQRPVKNGMMMVVVQGPQFSNFFKVNETLTTTSNVNLRQGPGTNYGILTSIPGNNQVKVIDHVNGSNGVWAKGYHWWLVEYNGNSGWVAEDFLSKP